MMDIASGRDIIQVSSFPTTGRIWLVDILKAVSEALRVNRNELISPRRHIYIVRARHIYFWVARVHTAQSLPRIGYACGCRDHSTVAHGVQKVRARFEEYREDIAKVEAVLGVSPTTFWPPAQPLTIPNPGV